MVSDADVPAWPARLAAIAWSIAVAALVLAAWSAPVRNNPASRISTIECLVDHGDWSIDAATHRYVTTDKVRVGDHFYSSKPPVYAAAGAVLYAGLQRATGWELAEHPQQVVFWLRLLMQVLPFGLGAIVAGRFLRREVTQVSVWFWGFVAFAGGTFVFGYSADVNNHSLAALLVLAAMVGTMRLGRGDNSAWLWLGTGFAAALAVTIDLGAGVFALLSAGFLLLKARRSGLAYYILGAGLPILVHAALSLHVTGSLLPFYGNDALYDYPGSYWLASRDFDALNEPAGVYGLHALLGHHGLLSMSPLFVLAIPGLWFWCQRTGQRLEGLWLSGSVVVTIGLYIGFGPRNYGGTAQGMRWFIILAPLLWLAALRFADRRWDRRWMRWALPILVLIGILHASLAIDNPWRVSPWNWLLRDLGWGSVPAWDW